MNYFTFSIQLLLNVSVRRSEEAGDEKSRALMAGS